MELSVLEYILSGSTLVASITAFFSIKANLKKNKAQADSAVAEADKAESEATVSKFKSYALLIDDLNGRLEKALTKMSNLEDELDRVKRQNIELTLERDRLQRENDILKEENARLTNEIKRLNC